MLYCHHLYYIVFKNTVEVNNLLSGTLKWHFPTSCLLLQLPKFSSMWGQETLLSREGHSEWQQDGKWAEVSILLFVFAGTPRFGFVLLAFSAAGCCNGH